MRSWLWRVACWTVILTAAVVLGAAVVVPRLAGATPYTVLTGSMRPSLPPGTLVVVRPVDPRDIGVGSVITYQLASGRQEVVTHRVVSQAFSQDGEPLFRTRGDANEVPDPDWVRPVQIRGEQWYAVPHLGRLGSLLTGHERSLATYGVATALLAYALAMFVGAARERRRPTGQPAHG